MKKNIGCLLSLLGLLASQPPAVANEVIPTADTAINAIQSAGAVLAPINEESSMMVSGQVQSLQLTADPQFGDQLRSLKLKNILHPMAIVGSDGLSLAWLARYADELTQQSAIIWLAESSGAADVARVQALVPRLIVLPMSADILATYGIHHYPLLLRVK